jgi:hypothetical protein
MKDINEIALEFAKVLLSGSSTEVHAETRISINSPKPNEQEGIVHCSHAAWIANQAFTYAAAFVVTGSNFVNQQRIKSKANTDER